VARVEVDAAKLDALQRNAYAFRKIATKTGLSFARLRGLKPSRGIDCFAVLLACSHRQPPKIRIENDAAYRS